MSFRQSFNTEVLDATTITPRTTLCRRVLPTPCNERNEPIRRDLAIARRRFSTSFLPMVASSSSENRVCRRIRPPESLQSDRFSPNRQDR